MFIQYNRLWMQTRRIQKYWLESSQEEFAMQYCRQFWQILSYREENTALGLMFCENIVRFL